MSLQEVKKMSTENLMDWLRKTSMLAPEKLDPVLKIIAEQQIDGATFIDFTYEEWKIEGLLGGVAKALLQIVASLRQGKIIIC
jgi:type IV secretory pathway ATPase VirB11/archaellum biosynthesis ATPase